jgi:CHAD domain-containing protein
VATRRLRSDLRTFRPLLDPDWAKELRDELGWLAESLGGVRDGDVLLGRIRKRAKSLPKEDGRGASRVLAALEADRGEAYDALLKALRSERYVALLDRLIEAANAPTFRSEHDLDAKAALQPLVDQPLETLTKHVSALDKDPDDEALHDVRIRTKRARYASEAVAPVLGKRARAIAAAAADLQDALGEHHDAVVAERWLRDWARATRSVPGAFAAGELAGLERAAADRAKRRWRKAWKPLARRS